MSNSSAQKAFGKIAFTNHLMFNAVLTENEDLCIRLIEAILERHVESVEYLEDETSIQPELDGRGARLDVLALVDGEYVDIEMQVGIEPQIERRCRFYHSAIATRYMPKSRGYESVPRSCIIFICLSDPLGAGLPRYKLSTACENDPSVRIDDGAETIILNAGAWEQENNSEVSGLLQYALTGSSEGSLARDIADAVEEKNLDRKWVRASMGVMTYEHEFLVLNNELERKRAEVEAAQAQVEAARSQAEAAQAEAEAAQAEAEAARAEANAGQVIQQLSKLLHRQGRIDEYIAALDDAQLMDSLLKEFDLA